MGKNSLKSPSFKGLLSTQTAKTWACLLAKCNVSLLLPFITCKQHNTMRLLTLLLLAFPFLGQAQSLPVDPETNRVTYEAVFDAPGIADTLYQRALDWFDSFYPNAKVVIKEREPDKGKITAKHKFNLQITDTKGKNQNVGFIIYDFKIWVKDNKVRYKIDDIHLEYQVYYGVEEWMKPNHEDAANNPAKLAKVDTYFKELIASLTQGCQPKEAPKDEDEW